MEEIGVAMSGEKELAKANFIAIMDDLQKKKANVLHDIEHLFPKGDAPEFMYHFVKWVEQYEQDAIDTLNLFDDEKL